MTITSPIIDEASTGLSRIPGGPHRRRAALDTPVGRLCPRCCSARRASRSRKPRTGQARQPGSADAGDLDRRPVRASVRPVRLRRTRTTSTISANGSGGSRTIAQAARLDQAGERVGRAATQPAPERQTRARSSATSRKPRVQRPQRQVALAGRRRRPRSGRRASSPRQSQRHRPACRIMPPPSATGSPRRTAPRSLRRPRRCGSRRGSRRRAPRRSGGRWRGRGRSCRRTPRPCGRAV